MKRKMLSARKTSLMICFVMLWGGWVCGQERAELSLLAARDDTRAADGPSDLETLRKLLPELSRLPGTHTDDLPGMLERKTIRVLTNYSMTNYFLSEGRSFGFEYSLLKEYEHFLNRDKGPGELGVVIEFIPVPEKLLVPSLLNGLGDIVAAGLTVTDKRPREVDFTNPYLTGVQQVLITNRDAKKINDMRDLSGRPIYVRPVIGYYESLDDLNARMAAHKLAPLEVIRANDFITNEDVLEMVNAGIIDLSITESHLAELWSAVLPNLKVCDQVGLDKKLSIAWMVRKKNPELKAGLNRFIKDHKKGTLLGNIYFNRYFRNTRWLKNPLNPDDRVRFSKFAPLFKKYGARYAMDWRLIAALAYQESGLDQGRRSPAGAIGLMQVLPSTARDKRINIDNLDRPENNVHAGTKYLALIRNTYFTDDRMSRDARLRYALAAYNAGPAKIMQCRDLAARMGYDPNRWFHHGEIGALKLIGEETVRYVSNINKYYLAYSLAAKMDRFKDQRLKALNPKR